MDDEVATQPAAARIRPWLRIGVLAGLLILAVAAIVWSQRSAIAEFAAERVAAQAGMGPLSLNIERLELDGATVSDITIGGSDGQRIGKIDAGYTLGGLWRGTVDRIAVYDLLLRGRTGPAGPVFAGFPAPEPGTPARAIPVRTLVFEGMRIRLETPVGPVTVHGDGEIGTPRGGASDIAAAFSIDSPFARAKGTLEATRLTTGETVARAALLNGSVAAKPLRASGLSGTAQVIALADGRLDLDANLAFESFILAGERLSKPRLSLGIRRQNGSVVSVEAVLTAARGRLETDGTVARSDNGVVTAAANIAADIDDGPIVGQGRATAELTMKPDGVADGTLRVGKGVLAHGGYRLTGIAGTVRFRRGLDTGLRGDAELTFDAFQALGLTGHAGGVFARLDASKLAAKADLAWSGGRLEISADGPRQGPLGFSASMAVDDVQAIAALFEGLAANGRASISLEGSIHDPLAALRHFRTSPVQGLGMLEARGEIDIDLDGIAVPDVIDGATMDGKIGFVSKGATSRLATDGLRLSANGIAQETKDRLPQAVRPHVAAPIRVSVLPRGGKAATVTVSVTDDAYEVDADAQVALTARDASLTLRSAVRAGLDAKGGLAALDTRRVEVDLNAHAGQLAANLVLSETHYAPGQVRSAFQVKALYQGSILSRLEPITAQAEIAGRANLDGTELSATVAPEGILSVAGIEAPEVVKASGLAKLRITNPLHATIDTAKGMASLNYRGTLSLDLGELEVKAGENWIGAAVSPATIAIRDSGARPNVSVEIAAIEVPAYRVRIAGIGVDSEISNSLTADLTAHEISHQANPAVVTPLRLKASLRGDGDRLSFAGKLFDPPERVSVDIAGQHDTATGLGAAVIEARKLVFLPTVLQPAQLFPVLSSTLREVDGEVDARANVAWGAEAFDSSLELLVNAKLIKAKEFSFENTASVIRFDSLLPLSTPPGQEVNIGALDVGVPMLNGRMEFQLKPDGSVEAALHELDFFGGRIETEPFTIPASYDGFTVPLLVNGVELENLLALAKSGDLSATGTLNGRIPVTVENAAVAIRGGTLESAPGGGTIRYSPTAVGDPLAEANEGMKLFLQIVEDFEYDKVRVTLDEDESGEVAFGFKIEGRNKAVYRGIPVVLNVTMDGPLRKILSQGLRSYKLPERILSRMRRFEDRQ